MPDQIKQPSQLALRCEAPHTWRRQVVLLPDWLLAQARRRAALDGLLGVEDYIRRLIERDVLNAGCA